MNKKLLIIILVLSIFVYGCSEKSPDITNNQNSADNTKTDSNKEGILSTVSSLTTLNEIMDIVSKGPTGQHKVSYDMNFGPDSPKTEMTTFWKNENRYRIDTVSTEMESRLFMVDNQATACSKENGKFMCYTTKPEEVTNVATDLSITEYKDEITQEGETSNKYKVYKDGTMTIAGYTAKCYSFEYTSEKEKICFSNEGVILYHKYVSANETSEFQAKSYSTTVVDSDFDLPAGAEIIDLNKELAEVRAEYGDQIADMEDIGQCYSTCDSQELLDSELETCYAGCLN